uniref:Uncharacterized protein n=1 Tax=Sphingobacterium sp. (strain 21) TaxID=743722 RepID=F4CC98_SPHS2
MISFSRHYISYVDFEGHFTTQCCYINSIFTLLKIKEYDE